MKILIDDFDDKGCNQNLIKNIKLFKGWNNQKL